MNKGIFKKHINNIFSRLFGISFLVNKILSWWVFSLGVIFTFIITLFLRFYNLTILPIFVDEAIYIRWAQVMRAEPTLRFLPLSDGKQPLFMWSIIPFFKLFSDPLFAGRFVSLLAGLVTFTGIGVFSYVLFKSKKISLISMFVYAISPYCVFFDRMALSDSMLSMFGIWTLIFGVLTVRTLRFDFSILTGFTLGGALLTKSPALFFTLLLPVIWLLAKWKRNFKGNIILWFRLLILSGISLVISQVMYNILRLGPNFHLLSSRNYDYVYPLNHIFVNFIDPFVPHLKDVLSWINYFGPKLLLVFIIVGLIIGLKKLTWEVIFLLVVISFPVLSQCMYAKVFTARYLYFVIPYLIILSSLAFTAKSKMLNIILYLIIIFYSFFALKQDYFLLKNPERMLLPRGERTGYLEEWTAGQGLKEASNYLRNEFNKEPSEKIVVGTDGYFGTMPDGLQIYLNDIPQIIITGVGVRFTKVPQALKDSVKSGNKTFLLVNSSRFFIEDPESVGLKLISSYPRAVKPDGTYESLFLFQLI